MFFKKSMLAVAAVSMLFAFGACKKGEIATDFKKGEIATDFKSAVALTAKWNKSDVNSLLGYIPADAIAYAFNTHNFDINSPEYQGIMKWGLALSENVIKTADKQLAAGDVDPEQKAAIESTKTYMSGIIALMKDYKTLAPEWGLDPNMHSDSVMFISDSNAVAIMTVSDGEKFKTKMTGIFDSLKTVSEEFDYIKSTVGEGENVWEVYAAKEAIDGTTITPAIAINITKTIITAAIINGTTPDPAKLAELKKPAAKSLTQKELGKINDKTGMIAKLDNVRLFELINDPQFAEMLKDENGEPIVSPECMKDTTKLISMMPSATMVYNFDSPTSYSSHAVLSLDANELKKIHALHTPSIDLVNDKSIAGVKVNLNIEQAINYITDLSSRLAQAQITCSSYQELVDLLKELPAQIANPMIAPYVKGITGINGALDALDTKTFKLEGAINITGPKIGELVPGLLAMGKGIAPEVADKFNLTKDAATTIDFSKLADLPVTVNATYTDQDIMFATASRGDVVSLAKTAKTNRHNFFEIYLSSDFMNIANDENVDFSTLFNGAEFNYTMGFGSNEQGLTMDVIYNFK